MLEPDVGEDQMLERQAARDPWIAWAGCEGVRMYRSPWSRSDGPARLGALASLLPPSYREDVARGVNGAPAGLVADVGCGSGAIARHLGLIQSGRYLGVDLDLHLLGVARRANPGVPWCCADAVMLPLADGRLAVVLAYESAHLFDLGAAGREWSRVLCSGGRLLIGSRSAQWETEVRDLVGTVYAAVGITIPTWGEWGMAEVLDPLLEGAGGSLEVVAHRTRSLERIISVDERVAVMSRLNAGQSLGPRELQVVRTQLGIGLTALYRGKSKRAVELYELLELAKG